MDPRVKIEQMLRKRRTEAVHQSAQPTPSPVVVEGEEFEATHAFRIEKIQKMLRQRISTQSAPPQPREAIVEEVRSVPEGSACPYCAGTLLSHNGLLCCNECSRRFTFRVTDGEIVDVESLAYGVCKCCLLRKPIIKDRNSMVCSISGEHYVDYKGEYLRVLDLPFGLCRCCESPRPLTVDSASRITCADTGTEYVRNLDGTVVKKPPQIDLSAISSVEAALDEGTAQFYYGGFIGTIARHRRRS